MSKLMNSGTLARLLGVDPSNVGNWSKAGKIPFVRRGCRRRFDLGAVCAALGIDPETIGSDGAAPAPLPGGQPAKEAARGETRGRKPDSDKCQWTRSLTKLLNPNSYEPEAFSAGQFPPRSPWFLPRNSPRTSLD